jgi:hypothetical protein
MVQSVIRLVEIVLAQLRRRGSRGRGSISRAVRRIGSALGLENERERVSILVVFATATAALKREPLLRSSVVCRPSLIRKKQIHEARS